MRCTMSKKIELNMQEKDIVDSLSHYAVNNAKTINLKSSFEYKWHCDECGQTFRCRAAVLMKSMMLFGKWCPVCTEIICVPGFNDLLTMHNGIVMEMSDRNLASRISLNVDKKVDFKCCFGHEFTMKPSELLHLFGTKYSCPECKRVTGNAVKQYYSG